jgi:hypothetical protein
VNSNAGLAGVVFTLNDGVSTIRPITFEFTSDGSVHGTNVPVTVGADVATTALNLAAQVNPSVQIVATASGATVALTNDVAGIMGEEAITVVPADTTAFTATGMSGGLGCPAGQRCKSGNDCVSGNCAGKTCR